MLRKCLALILTSQPAQQLIRVGAQDDGSAILSNGWRVKAAGTQVALDTFPMSSALSKDGKYIDVLTGGYKPPAITILTADTLTTTDKLALDDAWLGRDPLPPVGRTPRPATHSLP